MQIEVTFPIEIKPEKVKYIMEGSLKENSDYECSVHHTGEEDGENVFIIDADSPSAFYLAGITASGIIEITNYSHHGSNKTK